MRRRERAKHVNTYHIYIIVPKVNRHSMPIWQPPDRDDMQATEVSSPLPPQSATEAAAPPFAFAAMENGVHVILIFGPHLSCGLLPALSLHFLLTLLVGGAIWVE